METVTAVESGQRTGEGVSPVVSNAAKITPELAALLKGDRQVRADGNPR